MTMKEGVKEVAYATLDIKDQLCSDMIDAGVSPKDALLASTVAVKPRVDEIIERILGNSSASDITHNLAEIGRQNQSFN
ncbi:hypothetical protein [Pantoea ananatis]|jgi:hypothetical protein|uniref:hypothetical protein n=1 Tax=Pantoea ananas TaxID=553 RepID=UPI001FF092CC|nr:hypothetical protein [Pantoea ananatis]